MLLSTAYFPPLSWLALAARDMRIPDKVTTDPSSPSAPQDDKNCSVPQDDKNCSVPQDDKNCSAPQDDKIIPSVVLLEACENYQKQSYRNRCYILAGDGPQMLQVPVVHGDSWAIRAIRVDYSTPWVVRTERALDTAYETAAYYEYYRDEVFALLEAQPATLWELNLSTIRFLLDKTGIACTLEPTTDFAAPNTVADDYRFTLHPKRPDSIPEDLGLNRPYYQVFRDRLGGFTPKLSCLDLLFNEGPDSILWLKG